MLKCNWIAVKVSQDKSEMKKNMRSKSKLHHYICWPRKKYRNWNFSIWLPLSIAMINRFQFGLRAKNIVSVQFIRKVGWRVKSKHMSEPEERKYLFGWCPFRIVENWPILKRLARLCTVKVFISKLYVLMNGKTKSMRYWENRHPSQKDSQRHRAGRRKAKAIFNFCAMIYTSIPSRRLHKLAEASRQVLNPQGNESYTDDSSATAAKAMAEKNVEKIGYLIYFRWK